MALAVLEGCIVVLDGLLVVFDGLLLWFLRGFDLALGGFHSGRNWERLVILVFSWKIFFGLASNQSTRVL